jgi:hypothetical protein
VSVEAVRPFEESFDEIRFVFLDEAMRELYATA